MELAQPQSPTGTRAIAKHNTKLLSANTVVNSPRNNIEPILELGSITAGFSDHSQAPIGMLRHTEIDTEVNNLLNSIGLEHSLCKAIRELDSARGNLSTDKSGQLAKKVINKLAHVQRRLVEYTDLRQEEELNTAIELATDKIIQADHEEACQDYYPDSD